MASHGDFLSLSGLRADGRRPPEARKVRCAFGVLPHADGSACFEQGNTKVLVTVRGPREVRRRSNAQHDRAILECTYQLAPFAKVRHAKKRFTDRQALEAQIAVKQVFEQAIQCHLFPNSQIDINVMVLQTDGGAVCAAINAVTLAVQDAGIPMLDFVVACTAGYLERTTLVGACLRTRLCDRR